MNLTSSWSSRQDCDLKAREARFGMRVGAALSVSADSLPHDISERLRHARETALRTALARQTAASRQPALSDILISAGHTSTGASYLGIGRTGWLGRAASVLPLIALVAGLLLIDDLFDRAQIEAAAEVDAALLADDLPPDAYADPGFLEYLRTSGQ